MLKMPPGIQGICSSPLDHAYKGRGPSLDRGLWNAGPGDIDTVRMEATRALAESCSYPLERAFFDEAFEDEGVPRAHYEALIGWIGHTDLHALDLAVAADMHSRGVAFKSAQGDARFRADPVPRLIEAEEWDALAAGLAQRVRALNAFLADAYEERQIVQAGILPQRVIEG